MVVGIMIRPWAIQIGFLLSDDQASALGKHATIIKLSTHRKVITYDRLRNVITHTPFNYLCLRHDPWIVVC